jgi:hypothetical protein
MFHSLEGCEFSHGGQYAGPRRVEAGLKTDPFSRMPDARIVAQEPEFLNLREVDSRAGRAVVFPELGSRKNCFELHERAGGEEKRDREARAVGDKHPAGGRDALQCILSSVPPVKAGFLRLFDDFWADGPRAAAFDTLMP